MKVLGTDVLFDFCESHPDSTSSIKAWLAFVEDQNWEKFADIKNDYNHADWVGNRKVVFNLKGNNFRLLVQVAFNTGYVTIEKIGSHSDYTKWKL